MARSLLADGRSGDVAQMLEPLIRSSLDEGNDGLSARPGEILLRCLMARAILHHREDGVFAEQLLSPFSKLSARNDLSPEIRAEVALWLGWTFAIGKREAAYRASALLKEALQQFEAESNLYGICWSLIGLAKAYNAIGQCGLALDSLDEAAAIGPSLHDRQASYWIANLEETGTQCRSSLVSPASRLQLLNRRFVHAGFVMQRVIRRAERLSDGTQPLLLIGEKGSGKSTLARATHEAGMGSDAPFVKLSCALLSPAVLQRELDAASGRSGTLYFDEVGRLSPALQDWLSDFLDPVNATAFSGFSGLRVIASTSKPLDTLVCRDRFAEDLYYRLIALSIVLPPLRKRRDNIPVLTRHFLDALRPMGMPLVTVTDEVIHSLVRRDWPGNVQELIEEVERMIKQAASDPVPAITADRLTDAGREAQAENGRRNGHPHRSSAPEELDEILAGTERTYIEHVLRTHSGQITASAAALGLTRQGLYKKMKRLEIDPSRFQADRKIKSSDGPVNGEKR